MLIQIKIVLSFILRILILDQVFGAAILPGKSRGHAGIFGCF